MILTMNRPRRHEIHTIGFDESPRNPRVPLHSTTRPISSVVTPAATTTNRMNKRRGRDLDDGRLVRLQIEPIAHPRRSSWVG